MDRQAEREAAEQRRQRAIGGDGDDIVPPPAVRAAAEQRRQEAIEAETRQFHQLLLAETSLHMNRQAYDDDGPVVQAMIDRVRLERGRLDDRSAAASSADELCVNLIRDTYYDELHDRHHRRRLERAAALQAARTFAGVVGEINPGGGTRRVPAAPAVAPAAPIAPPATPIAPPATAADDDAPPVTAAGGPRMGSVDSFIRPSSKRTHPGEVKFECPRRSKRLKMKVRRYSDESDGSDEVDDYSEEKDEFDGFEDGGDDGAAAA
ncbi:hypothetical protein BBJ28_00025944 [Nothophytophthora sp. Chile5]|nr:hypothetical protein BBJ28_00025944 [Nothophytophthora sp. Chile5]